MQNDSSNSSRNSSRSSSPFPPNVKENSRTGASATATATATAAAAAAAAADDGPPYCSSEPKLGDEPFDRGGGIPPSPPRKPLEEPSKRNIGNTRQSSRRLPDRNATFSMDSLDSRFESRRGKLPRQNSKKVTVSHVTRPKHSKEPKEINWLRDTLSLGSSRCSLYQSDQDLFSEDNNADSGSSTPPQTFKQSKENGTDRHQQDQLSSSGAFLEREIAIATSRQISVNFGSISSGTHHHLDEQAIESPPVKEFKEEQVPGGIVAPLPWISIETKPLADSPVTQKKNKPPERTLFQRENSCRGQDILPSVIPSHTFTAPGYSSAPSLQERTSCGGSAASSSRFPSTQMSTAMSDMYMTAMSRSRSGGGESYQSPILPPVYRKKHAPAPLSPPQGSSLGPASASSYSRSTGTGSSGRGPSEIGAPGRSLSGHAKIKFVSEHDRFDRRTPTSSSRQHQHLPYDDNDYRRYPDDDRYHQEHPGGYAYDTGPDFDDQYRRPGGYYGRSFDDPYHSDTPGSDNLRYNGDDYYGRPAEGYHGYRHDEDRFYSRSDRFGPPAPAPAPEPNHEAPPVMVEIEPGFSVPLRRTQETIDAISVDFYTPAICFSCSQDIFSIADVEYVVCPGCRVVSPVDGDYFEGRRLQRHGLGLGFTCESLAKMQAEILKQRSSSDAVGELSPFSHDNGCYASEERKVQSSIIEPKNHYDHSNNDPTYSEVPNYADRYC